MCREIVDACIAACFNRIYRIRRMTASFSESNVISLVLQVVRSVPGLWHSGIRLYSSSTILWVSRGESEEKWIKDASSRGILETRTRVETNEVSAVFSRYVMPPSRRVESHAAGSRKKTNLVRESCELYDFEIRCSRYFSKCVHRCMIRCVYSRVTCTGCPANRGQPTEGWFYAQKRIENERIKFSRNKMKYWL